MDQAVARHISISNAHEPSDPFRRDPKRFELNQRVDCARAVSGASQAVDIAAVYTKRGKGHQVGDAGRRITSCGDGIDHLAARIHGHQTECLLAVRSSDAPAHQQLGEGGVVGEAAIARRIASAAIPGTVEPPGFADYGEVKRPGAGSAKGGHLQPGKLRGQEARRPVVVTLVAVMAEGPVDFARIAVLWLQRKADRVCGLRAGGYRKSRSCKERGANEGEGTVHHQSP